MKIFKAIMTAVTAERKPAGCYDKDFYIFIPEDKGFSAYTTDSFGKKWSCVTRWVLEEQGYGKEEKISVRPFSMTDIVSGSKKAELEHIFSHILYDRAPLGAHGTAKAIVEPFDRYRLGSLALSLDLPAETILRDSYILLKNSHGRSVSAVGPEMIGRIMEELGSKAAKER